MLRYTAFSQVKSAAEALEFELWRRRRVTSRTVIVVQILQQEVRPVRDVMVSPLEWTWRVPEMPSLAQGCGAQTQQNSLRVRTGEP
jgi:hypothetical protein